MIVWWIKQNGIYEKSNTVKPSKRGEPHRATRHLDIEKHSRCLTQQLNGRVKPVSRSAQLPWLSFTCIKKIWRITFPWWYGFTGTDETEESLWNILKHFFKGTECKKKTRSWQLRRSDKTQSGKREKKKKSKTEAHIRANKAHNEVLDGALCNVETLESTSGSLAQNLWSASLTFTALAVATEAFAGSRGTNLYLAHKRRSLALCRQYC